MPEGGIFHSSNDTLLPPLVPPAGRIAFMNVSQHFLAEHQAVTRRFFLRAGAACAVLLGGKARLQSADLPAPELAGALEKLEPYFTPPRDFRDVSRGKPVPHTLPEE